MSASCSCFAAPLAARQLSRVSSFCGIGNTLKLSRPRSYSLAAGQVSQSPKHPELRRGNWQARRAQHGSPPVHSSPIRPKQSLGQNFLQDRATIDKIVTAFNESFAALSPSGSVVEIGAGTGALTTSLYRIHPSMLAVELDVRAVDYMRVTYPAIEVLQADVLDLDWGELATTRGGPLAVVGNLPYNIVSQILFSMLEAPADTLAYAVVMMQKEVAERIGARTRTKAYGILSVVAQLYARPTLLFDVANKAFYPRPSITSTMVRFEFTPHACLDVTDPVLTGGLRLILRAAFQQRRKTLRNSLRAICAKEGVTLSEEWAGRRPEEISPEGFVYLTRFVYAKKLADGENADARSRDTARVWRPRKT